MKEHMNNDVAIPFNAKKQRAVLGHLLSDRSFFLQCKEQIKPHWFNEEVTTRQVYEILLDFFKTHSRRPSIPEMEGCPAIMSRAPDEARRIVKHIHLCLAEADNYGLDAIRSELTEWLRAVIFASALTEAKNAYNKQRFNEVEAIFTDVSKQIKDVRFDSLGELSFDNIVDDLVQMEVDTSNAISTGLRALDSALLDGATTGGLLRRDTTVIMAPVNTGKSTFMITVACHNMRQGKEVLYMTHEGAPEEIRAKFMQNLIGCTRPELQGLIKTEKGRQILNLYKVYAKKFLTYIPYNKPGMTVEEVEPIIRRAIEERAAANNGKTYDLLIVDYPAKLFTDRARKGGVPRREIDRIVYDYYVQLALEYGFHSLLAIQTNREGSKVNQGKEDRLLTMEDVSESWGVMEMASNVITINRSPLAKSRNRITYYVDKSRSSATGTAIVCNSKFENSITHSEELGAVWYADQRTMEDRIDDLLNQYSGQRIPEELLW